MKNRVKQASLIMLLAITVSCGETHIYEVVNRTKTIEIQTEIIVKKVQGNDNYKIVVIDGCEYISYLQSVHYSGVGTVGVGGGLTHKGNCKNH